MSVRSTAAREVLIGYHTYGKRNIHYQIQPFVLANTVGQFGLLTEYRVCGDSSDGSYQNFQRDARHFTNRLCLLTEARAPALQDGVAALVNPQQFCGFLLGQSARRAPFP